jgi:hypothetical protein
VGAVEWIALELLTARWLAWELVVDAFIDLEFLRLLGGSIVCRALIAG